MTARLRRQSGNHRCIRTTFSQLPPLTHSGAEPLGSSPKRRQSRAVIVRHSKTHLVKMKVRDEKLKAIIDWSKNNRDIRAVLLTSSLVNPLAPVDDFSDLDIELIFENNAKYISDNTWTENFGNPIAMVEEDETYFEGKHAMKMVL